jgi:hypothetical protein
MLVVTRTILFRGVLYVYKHQTSKSFILVCPKKTVCCHSLIKWKIILEAGLVKKMKIAWIV